MVYLNPGVSPTSLVRPSHLSFKLRKTAVASLPIILLLLDVLRVPIIILIATTGAELGGAVAISAVSVSSNHNDNASDNYDTLQKPPSKLSFNSDENGNGSSISLSYGGLVFNKPKELDSSSAKKMGLVKRGGGETRITSNQDVTTLALAVDNSSSVAIANINSSWNNVQVTIGSQQYQPHPK